MSERPAEYNVLDPEVRREVDKRMVDIAAPTIEETRDMFSRAAELDAADWLATEHPNMATAVSQWIRNHGGCYLQWYKTIMPKTMTTTDDAELSTSDHNQTLSAVSRRLPFSTWPPDLRSFRNLPPGLAVKSTVWLFLLKISLTSSKFPLFCASLVCGERAARASFDYQNEVI